LKYNTDQEIKLNNKKYIISKTDAEGIIEYGNEYFVEISGYSEAELVGSAHNILRHPDMPKIIFKMMWARLKDGNNITAIIKNKAKDGRFYWVITEFESKKEPISGDVISHMAYRRAAPENAIKIMQPLYQKLLEIEQKSGIEASEKYLIGFLENKKLNYDTFISNAIGNSTLMKLFFITMKNFFN
jgi:PAS domain S-box-containing protein